MGRFIKSTEQLLLRPRRFFASLPYGPIVVTPTKTTVVAETADGLRVELGASTAYDRRLHQRSLQEGIEVTVDGRPAGHLTQADRGFRRRNRVMHLTSTEPGRFPDGGYFRLRDLGDLSFEVDGRRLLSYWFLIRRVRADDRVTPELAAVFAAVEAGLREPLRQGSYVTTDSQ